MLHYPWGNTAAYFHDACPYNDCFTVNLKHILLSGWFLSPQVLVMWSKTAVRAAMFFPSFSCLWRKWALSCRCRLERWRIASASLSNLRQQYSPQSPRPIGAYAATWPLLIGQHVRKPLACCGAELHPPLTRSSKSLTNFFSLHVSARRCFFLVGPLSCPPPLCRVSGSLIGSWFCWVEVRFNGAYRRDERPDFSL